MENIYLRCRERHVNQSSWLVDYVENELQQGSKFYSILVQIWCHVVRLYYKLQWENQRKFAASKASDSTGFNSNLFHLQHQVTPSTQLWCSSVSELCMPKVQFSKTHQASRAFTFLHVCLGSSSVTSHPLHTVEALSDELSVSELCN